MILAKIGQRQTQKPKENSLWEESSEELSSLVKERIFWWWYSRSLIKNTREGCRRKNFSLGYTEFQMSRTSEWRLSCRQLDCVHRYKYVLFSMHLIKAKKFPSCENERASSPKWADENTAKIRILGEHSLPKYKQRKRNP